jgi:hypothetical protein
MFATGHGRTVTCALGNGRFLYPVIDSENVISFLELSDRFGPAGAANTCVRRFLNPFQAYYVKQCLEPLIPKIIDPISYQMQTDELGHCLGPIDGSFSE